MTDRDHSQVLHILQSRNNENMHEQSRALMRDIEALQGIANDTRSQSKTIASIARQASRDSQSIKALTTVATMYLPASLLAVRDPSRSESRFGND
jgi:hypothetical protein